MLSKLRIKNIVLIEAAELDFLHGLNVLSGETGAGKSILIDAVMLLLGERYDKTLLRYNAESGFVEGLFLLNQNAKNKLVSLGLEPDDEALIVRNFYKDGKSDIRINGRVITATMLKSIASSLIDIYGQNDYRYYADKNVQLNVLDFYCRKEINAPMEELFDTYQEYKKIKKELSELGDESQQEKNIDFLRFQIKEIEAANIKENEEEELLDTRRIALNAEKIAQNINQSLEGLKSDGLNSALSGLKKLEGYDQIFEELSARLQSVLIETDDIFDTLRSQRERFRFDSTQLDKIEERLMAVRSIKRKYGDYQKTKRFVADAKKQLEKLENGAELYIKLSAQKTLIVDKLYSLSQKISLIRKEKATELSKKIELELSQLGMERACFEIRFDEFAQRELCEKVITQRGMDGIEFYLSANKGQPLKPFIKIVSGGEMSRFMLALKVITGDSDSIPTLIFDEIDAGISGKVGQEVAKKLARIALSHQVLCVTHLPQIASMADAHFLISKQLKQDDTITLIKNLDHSGMVLELSRLCGSIGISDKSESNAEGMKKWSQDYKDSIIKK